MRHEQDDPLARLESDVPEGPNLDVLLQLTFPIVLILAFFVVTEVTSLQSHLTDLLNQMTGTETRILGRQRDIALIELKKQLLWKAINEEMEQERVRCRLDEYLMVLPSGQDVLKGQVDRDFQTISSVLADRFDGPERLERTRVLLAILVDTRYQLMIDRFVIENADFELASIRKLRELSHDDMEFVVDTLKGHTNDLVDDIASLQMRVILSWLRSERASAAMQAQSQSLWERIQVELGLVPEERNIERFVNLKVEELRKRLAYDRAPQLAETYDRVR